MSESRGLTPKVQRFVDEYVIDLNGKQAAIRSGYKESRAERTASELLAQRKVSEAVAFALAARSKRTQIDADWVLRSLADEKTADISALYDDAGNLRPVKDWPMVFRTGLVVGIDTVQERDGTDADGKPQYVTVKKIRLSDRIKVTELIGRHVDVQAFRDRLAVEDTTDRAEQMRRRRALRSGGKD